MNDEGKASHAGKAPCPRPARIVRQKRRCEHGEQTDIWAFSVVLYELITGRRPFSGESLGAVIAAIFSKEPVPTTQLGAGDEELWSILRRGLAKAPAERWPSMRSLGRALASWAVERGVTADVAGTSLAHQSLARGVDAPLTAERAAPVLAATGAVSAPAAPRPPGAGRTLLASPAAAATPAGRRGSRRRATTAPRR
ncbi:protein kinase [Sorangium sp. So ce362]|uniref:protein kinase n=1 Tax=Sorangium sp. So ce362 TaxID=3133303 RepID=UPI003F616A91